MVSVDADGNYYLTLQGAKNEALEARALRRKSRAFMRKNPERPVLVGGDARGQLRDAYTAHGPAAARPASRKSA